MSRVPKHKEGDMAEKVAINEIPIKNSYWYKVDISLTVNPMTRAAHLMNSQNQHRSVTIETQLVSHSQQSLSWFWRIQFCISTIFHCIA